MSGNQKSFEFNNNALVDKREIYVRIAWAFCSHLVRWCLFATSTIN